jgi:hypothetical protein
MDMETMTMADENYREQIARLAQEAHAREVAAAETEANQLNVEANELWEQAKQADDSGDGDYAIELARLANQKNQELQSKLAQLPQPQQYSERKVKWAQRRPDLVNHPQFAQYADFYHNYVTQNMGVPDDSDNYEELMTAALEPGGDYQPTPTADDIIKTINETSKYCDPTRGGKPLTGKDWNKQVARIRKERGG